MASGADDIRLRAVAALDTAIESCAAARERIAAVITRKRLEREDTLEEEAQRADLDATIGDLEIERAEYRAAAVVVRAPTSAEIAAVRAQINRIRALAVDAAAARAGRDVMRDVLRAAINLKSQNAKV